MGDISPLAMAMELMHKDIAIHVSQHKPFIAASHGNANGRIISPQTPYKSPIEVIANIQGPQHRAIIIQHRIAHEKLFAAVSIYIISDRIMACIQVAGPKQIECVVKGPDRFIAVLEAQIAPCPSAF